MLLTVFAVIKQQNLFASVILLSIYSLLAAALFVAMDAVDVAFTEAAVGAGISTILMLATLLYVGKETSPKKKVKWPIVLASLALAVLLCYGTYDLPNFGHDGNTAAINSTQHDYPAKLHSHPVTTEFLRESMKKTGATNVVTSILASYRGYDTLGEVTVVLCAGIGVIVLLTGVRSGRYDAEDES